MRKDFFFLIPYILVMFFPSLNSSQIIPTYLPSNFLFLLFENNKIQNIWEPNKTKNNPLPPADTDTHVMEEFICIDQLLLGSGPALQCGWYS